ncbi:putative glutamate synthase [NADPH] [Zancudomyces culisetae]|uniref:Glutamate synthase [NADH] n=1 Tax=Zancudomyces culisetae TaxID=1213189 RepID=A0A1R1PU41_ZANCU|nr:putative glutamate synthase [NADPH] [Zancudomyces culisetae]|eukprot:OMH84516.1 putative glutamate synthase [NADPH] [Zancudomyces culisetae]
MGWKSVLPQKSGLYNPENEVDSCGVGFVIDINGKPTHDIIRKADYLLSNMEHRGAEGADSRDGDGAGIMASMPHKFMRKVWSPTLSKLDNTQTRGDLNGVGCMNSILVPGAYATGNVFFNRNTDIRQKAMDAFEKSAAKCGLRVVGWRKVPVDRDYIGPMAKKSEPTILQPLIVPQSIEVGQDLISKDKDQDSVLAFERKLFLFRKVVTNEIRSESPIDGFFYVSSLSSQKIVYKGLLLSRNLNAYYLDLNDSDFTSHFALVHSRFSTNTFPSWDRAQPNRLSAHNGEINTLKGNKNWMRSREGLLESAHFTKKQLEQIYPIIEDHGSDSQAFDNVVELLMLGGVLTLPEAVMLMIPEAWQNIVIPDDNSEQSTFIRQKRAFYEWASSIMEPWDGPALMTFSDGRFCGATLDRNGLRPCRYYITNDDVMICASEVGAINISPENVKSKGRLMPGKMLLVDTVKGEIISDDTLKGETSTKYPFADWIAKKTIDINALVSAYRMVEASDSTVPCTDNRGVSAAKSDIFSDPRLAAFGYSIEEINMLLLPMIYNGKEALGSMGNDTVLACLDSEPRLPFDYLRQVFAQVTNPPIDPIREKVVMTLECLVGPEHNTLDVNKDQVNRIRLPSFLLSSEELEALRNIQKVRESGLDESLINSDMHVKLSGWSSKVLDISFEREGGVEAFSKRISDLCFEAAECVRNGVKILILSDRNVNKDRVSLFSLLASSAVHQRLVREKLRLKVALVVEAADVREVHHFCTIIGYGADAICPYFAYELIAKLSTMKINDCSEEGVDKILLKYRNSINDGVKKVMSKMGISTLQSYKGAQIFEALGINDEVMEMCFMGTPSRIGGATFSVFAADAIAFHYRGYGCGYGLTTTSVSKELEPGKTQSGGVGKFGEYHWANGGKNHVNTPSAIASLQHAVREKNQASWDAYTKENWDNAVKKCTLRGLLEIDYSKTEPIPIEQVEPWTEIVKKFCTGAMSYGSISLEAHTSLAIAMNKLGGKSNSGEGGEDSQRYIKKENGDSERSAIKQIASGRFGVTSHYLANADELQIKMAQGAKPGEGGELPGHKVSGKIAETRHSTEGVGLISPPPHHDIYSIEDLKELIYDLKGANPRARISVKLVSVNGVGVVASGVAKAKANHILISGHDGGTGASRWTGIKYAGLPWELGLAETHQTLVLNNLREKVVIQTDGQLKTAKDVIMAALLGANEFGFATTPLIALGCTMMRKCHLNTCPVGIATQDPVLREKFAGKPEDVINFFYFLAEDIRKILASLGYSKLEDIVGKAQYLKMDTEYIATSEKAKYINLSGILKPATEMYREYKMSSKITSSQSSHDESEIKMEIKSGESFLSLASLAATLEEEKVEEVLLRDVLDAIESGKKVNLESRIKNTDRAFGSTFSYYVSLYHGAKGLPQNQVHIKLNGSAGQSLGAFLASGITVEVEGDCNDYVGKGLSGGVVIVYPPRGSRFSSNENVIVGNVCLYGATSGEAYISGIAAERFAVRNSGAIAVVEGVGDHGCEYMTGGRVVIIGETGINFAAGMSGGIAYVYCKGEKGSFVEKVNMELVEIETLESKEEIMEVKKILEKHVEYTGSQHAQHILQGWTHNVGHFVKVIPTEYKKILEKKNAKNAQPTRVEHSKKTSKSVETAKVVDLEDLVENKAPGKIAGQKNKRSSAEEWRDSTKIKVKGFMKIRREGEEYRDIVKRVKDWGEISNRMSKAKLKQQAARCMDCGVPFCQSDTTGCPIGNMIPKWNELVYQDDWRNAFERLMETNNFPEFTGRVCPAPCEGSCVLGINSDPVAIKSIEAAIIDYAWEQGWMTPQLPTYRTGKRIAIVGSGPAGLSAADQLNKAGHTVTVYEREDRVGGLLMYGIPNMKLDKENVLRRRTDKMEREGVCFVTGVNVGVDITTEQLMEKNDAVLLAIGSTKPRDLGIEGRNLNGIHFAMDYLTPATKNMIYKSDISAIDVNDKNVIIIGGGDTGNDCIATSVRQGARSVTNFELLMKPAVGRRNDKENPWPQFPRVFKVDYGHAEAKEVYGTDPRIYCISTKRFIGDDQGNLKGLETVQVQWTKAEGSGRWEFKEVEGSTKIFAADVVLISMGFVGPEKSAVLGELTKCDTNDTKGVNKPSSTVGGFGMGCIEAHDTDYKTEFEGVFAAGDCRRGQSLVVWAINEGRQAARSIDDYLVKKSDPHRNSQLPVSGGAVKRLIDI